MSASVEMNVWGRILHSLKGRLNQQTLDTWFSPIQFESLDSSQHVLRLRAPNQVVKDWVVSNYGTGGDPANRGERLGSEPFAAVTSKADRFKVQFRNNNQDNAYVRLEDEPSGTIFTGYRANWMGWERADDGTFIRKVTSEEAATLQTFPADHRFLGTKSQVMTQIGNAVPPLLAEALLAQFPLESQG